jgi:hypothetical protein
MYAVSVALTMGLRVVRSYGSLATAPWVQPASSSLSLAIFLIVVAWVYLAWRGIPASHRGTMTPSRAACTLLLPVYNLYWAFAMNLALCDTLDGVLVAAGSDKRAPRTLAIVATTSWVVLTTIFVGLTALHRANTPMAILLTVAVDGLWFAYMILCDRAREEVARLGDDASALGVPRLSRIQRTKGTHPVAVIALSFIAIVGFFGCWQILQPSERTPASVHQDRPGSP